MSGHSGYGDDTSDAPSPMYEGIVKNRPGFPPGDGFVPGDMPYAKSSAPSNTSSKARSQSGRSGRGIDDNTYEDTYASRGLAARDGYARDSISDAYEERMIGYGDHPVRGEGYSRGYEQPQYQQVSRVGHDRRRLYDELDERDYEDRRRVARYHEREREISRSRSRKSHDHDRSSSRDSSIDSRDEQHDNTPMKKWTATLAGAALGGFTAHKTNNKREKDANWVPAAIGAVVGGLVAREAEKEVFKRRAYRREEREMEDRRTQIRSYSR